MAQNISNVECISDIFGQSFLILATAVFLLESLVGFLLNLFVIFVFLRSKKWRTPTALLTIYLAECDLLIASISISLTTALLWKYPHNSIVYSAIAETVLGSLRFFSIATVVLISYDRKECVSRRLRPGMSINATKKSIISLLIFSILILILPLIPTMRQHASGEELQYCQNISLTNKSTSILYLLVYFLLCMVLLYNYHKVQTAARKRISALPAINMFQGIALRYWSHTNNNDFSSKAKNQQARVTKISRLVIFSVCILWAPYLILAVIQSVVTSSKNMRIAKICLLATGYLTHVTNPLLYALPSSYWRESVSSIVPCLRA